LRGVVFSPGSSTYNREQERSVDEIVRCLDRNEQKSRVTIFKIEFLITNILLDCWIIEYKARSILTSERFCW